MDVSFLEAAGLTLAVVIVFTLLLRGAQKLWRRGRAGPGPADPKSVINERAGAAQRLYFAGQLVGLVLLTTSIVHYIVTEEESWAHDILWCFSFSAVGFALYVIAGQLGVRVLLGRHLADEIDSGNTAAGLAGGAHHVAMGLIAGATCAGTDLFGLSLASAFFVVAVILQQGVAALFRAMTAYDDAEQIAGENMAAAISWGGTSIAAAIVIARAAEGEAATLAIAIEGFFEVAVLALLLLPVRQILVGGLLFGRMPKLRGGPLDDAVGLQHDTATAALDAAIAIGTAIALARLA
ncbi:MAG: DUF350 domain-containing protein [Deltaproteobacteria bacterium]|nr:DUF350 domain-containing protein [Deltaproteobacteria bacterium]